MKITYRKKEARHFYSSVVGCWVFCSLSACTVYTVTNKTQQDLQIETTQEVTELKAGQCIELTEYFLGLAGDFPFVLVGEKNERNPGHYEITEVKQAESQEDTAENTAPAKQPYKMSLSEKNPECNKEEEEEDEDSKKADQTPFCGEKSKKATCSSSGEARCLKIGEQYIPACIDKEGKNLSHAPQCAGESIKPKCSKSEITEAQKWTEDLQRNVFCLDGQPACSEGIVKCIKEEGSSSTVPACVQDETKTNSQVVCSPAVVSSINNKAMCLFPVSVDVVNQAPLCSGASAQCSSGGRIVCGKTPGDSQNKAYCVNAEGIRLPHSVTCPNEVTPSCQGTSI